MSTADLAMRKRENVATKLRDSVRQLRRYLDGDDHIERILASKSEKVDVDKEELIAKHIEYANKAGLELTDEALTQYIEPKIDDAVDVVDEAVAKIEELSSNSQTAIENSKLRLDITALKLQATRSKTLIAEILDIRFIQGKH